MPRPGPSTLVRVPHTRPLTEPEATAYLKRILTSRVYDVVDETPLDPAPLLSARLGATGLR